MNKIGRPKKVRRGRPKGYKMSEETKQKIIESRMNGQSKKTGRKIGFVTSEETKEKIRKSLAYKKAKYLEEVIVGTENILTVTISDSRTTESFTVKDTTNRYDAKILKAKLIMSIKE